jgi:hypothetical protein
MGSNQYGVLKTVVTAPVVVEETVVEVPVVEEVKAPARSSKKKEDLGKPEEV